MHRTVKACIIILLMILIPWHIETRHDLRSSQAKESIPRILTIKKDLTELMRSYINASAVEVQPNCVQMRCRVICFKGRSDTIERDIKRVLVDSRQDCHILKELCLYMYEFPNGIVSRNFLGEFSNKVESLYIGKSVVTGVESGAFGNGIYSKLTFENLNFSEIRSDFLENISIDFHSLTISQANPTITSIHQGFLSHVQSQIKHLALQVGVTSVRNMTSPHILLKKLKYLDYSYNDFGSDLTADDLRIYPMVKHLDLSHSGITVLTSHIFSAFVDTLTYLDVSHNRLKTLSADIFGWKKTRTDLAIYANDNEWKCNCQLNYDMKALWGHQLSKVYCKTPEKYRNWSVFDSRLCEDTERENTTTITTTNPSLETSTRHSLASKDEEKAPNITSSVSSSSQHPIRDNVELLCQYSTTQYTKSPSIAFDVASLSHRRVDVLLRMNNFKKEKYGLVWFNKVTKDFYKMEINYNEYGLGCYGTVSHRSTVKDLLPNVAYTFCIVEQDQPTVSPFNCKSIHITGDIQTRCAWISQDNRSIGISLTIFGIVICTFIGTLFSFLILKQKPILLKGSKRVATTKCNVNEIVVLPKDLSLDQLRIREEILAERSSKRLSRISGSLTYGGSTGSNASYQSYMNTNLYEELPAYINIDLSSISGRSDCNYNYAEIPIPFQHKRTSNDPLPKVPQDVDVGTDADADTDCMSSQQLEMNDIFKHNFELTTGYAFAYDCVV